MFVMSNRMLSIVLRLSCVVMFVSDLLRYVSDLVVPSFGYVFWCVQCLFILVRWSGLIGWLVGWFGLGWLADLAGLMVGWLVGWFNQTNQPTKPVSSFGAFVVCNVCVGPSQTCVELCPDFSDKIAMSSLFVHVVSERPITGISL